MSDKQIGLAPEPPDPGVVERFLLDRMFGDAAASLDAEGHRIVLSVLCRDTADVREELARKHIAAARTDLTRLASKQERVGTIEQMQAIKRTGTCPDAHFWLVASWLLLTADAVFWFIAAAQAFTF